MVQNMWNQMLTTKVCYSYKKKIINSSFSLQKEIYEDGTCDAAYEKKKY